MAIIKAPSMQDRVYVGAHGNVSIAKAKAVLAAAAIGTEVQLLELPIGMDVQGIRITTENLGASVTGTVKIGDKEIKTGVVLSSAATIDIPCDEYLEEKAVLSITIAGAAASGTLKVNTTYLAVGY